ncbi:MAG: galactokinase [bacterium]|nr:galactokinase [bacterium]
MNELRDAFSNAFPDAGPPRICRAPGRINLIGEHVDYNGLPVLPMAIDREIRIAFAPRATGQVRLRSMEGKQPAAEFENGQTIAPSDPGQWDNYCKAAFQGLNDHLNLDRHPGADLLVTGTIPSAAGLSSSSALVVACALAYLHVLEVPLGEDMTRLDLASMLAEAEQYVGTRGGGMDQAIILLGEAGKACKINFYPLRAEEVPLFDGYAFVACNSLVKAEKTGDALHRYNAGPLTCRLIRALVEKEAQREFGEEIEIARLGDLWYGPLCLTFDEVGALFEAAFPTERTTLAQAQDTLGMTEAAIRDAWLGSLVEPEGGFRLRARAKHQITEFKRVEVARDMAQTGDATAFGALMNESHTSCAEDYRVSCPELDQLVAAARRAGSLGSRLTGAGFGGCTVNLVPDDRVDAFRDQVTREYYEGHLRRSRDDVTDAMLVVQATAGAGYTD